MNLTFPGTRRSFRNKLILVLFSLLFAVTVVLPGCSTNEPTPVLKIGMLLGSGGLGDRSFNDSAYAGLLEAQQNYNIRFETVEYTSAEESLETAKFMARNGYDLIIGIGYEHTAPIQAAAEAYPDTKFAAIDFEVEAPNVASIVYREQEGDFLIGVLAAMLTETKKVGVIGGMDIPSIQRIMSGFTRGVRYQDDAVEVVTDFAGTFSDAEIGLEKALAMYDEGVDIIHNAASRTGLGIIEAAKQEDKLTTGTSGDQRYLAPGNVVGNRPKRVDTAVLLVIRELYNGSFTAGIRSLGLKENGIMLGPWDETIVTPEMMERLDDLKEKIIGNQITIEAD